MVKYHIKANVEDDPLDSLLKRLLNYLRKENYNIKTEKENSLVLHRPLESYVDKSFAMQQPATIHLEWDTTTSSNNYPLSLHLTIDTSYLIKEEQEYWDIFVKNLESVICNQEHISMEHHRIREKYLKKFENSEGVDYYISLPMVLLFIAFLIIYMIFKFY